MRLTQKQMSELFDVNRSVIASTSKFSSNQANWHKMRYVQILHICPRTEESTFKRSEVPSRLVNFAANHSDKRFRTILPLSLPKTKTPDSHSENRAFCRLKAFVRPANVRLPAPTPSTVRTSAASWLSKRPAWQCLPYSHRQNARLVCTKSSQPLQSAA